MTVTIMKSIKEGIDPITGNELTTMQSTNWLFTLLLLSGKLIKGGKVVNFKGTLTSSNIIRKYQDKLINKNSAKVNSVKKTSGAESSLKYKDVYFEGSSKVGGLQKDISRKVHQLENIDFNRIDEATGLTNLELMKKGKSPLWKDGRKIELHHTLQMEPGPIAELPASLHDKYYSVLHGLVENGSSFRNNAELAKQYNNFRSQYWRWRATQIK